MLETVSSSEDWISRFHPAPDSSVRLVCLPHAGGSASFFFPVSKALAPAVEVLAIQYPGRQNRLHVPPIDNLSELADGIFGALRLRLDDRPLALFGHSMGAVLAYEVALRLQRSGLPSPARLFVSGRQAPSCYRDGQIHRASDDEVVASLQALSGTSQAILDDPELLAVILPAIRSDYHAVAGYQHDPAQVLNCPVTVLTGDSDPQVSINEARAWAEHTTGQTDVEVFPGGHFFVVDRSSEVIGLLSRELRNLCAGLNR
ncbi:thioesterase II family protein [Streptomyces sp. NPDC093591]|uniref:thioesterase II family protein n=1 Tax=Streptomyces sp. NPDC093591 TaxID=3366044 RepID=UPI00382F20B5